VETGTKKIKKMTNEQTIIKLYEALQKKDFKTMGECYHDKATFKDPAFDLKTGNEVRAMWEMLCKQSKELRIDYSKVTASGNVGSAHWEAKYLFSKTGRRVHNKIDAVFAFKDGLIVRHIDRFSFWRWSAQALGPVGQVAGWFPPLKWKVRAQAKEGLAQFMAREEG